MATAAQVSANRRNAAKSTGPKTKVGKAIVAQNAIKHGLLARQHVVLGEDPEQFEACRRQWIEEIGPVTNAESTLAERIAGLAWRLKRAERLQNELFDCLLSEELYDSMEDFDDELSPARVQDMASDPQTDPALAVGRMLKRDYAHERGLERLMMLERWIESSLYKSMKELRLVQRERKSGTAVETQYFASGEGFAGNGPCGAKQSQAEEVSRVKGQVSGEAGSARGDSHPLETTPIGPAGVACRVPVETSVETQAETQNIASLQEEAPARLADSAKQSQSKGVSGLKCGVPGGAGSGPADNASCETKPIDAAGSACTLPARARPEPAEGTSKATPCGVTTNGVDCAKQSQCPGSAAGARALPRALRRVAWHYHNTPRSS